MRPNWKSLSLLPSLALLLAFAGCEPGSVPDTPVAPPTPSLSTSPDGSLQKAEGTLPTFYVEKVIGPEGGVLGVPDYYLTVPKGAVSQPTLFTFESVDGDHVQVRLTATAVGSGTVNDVGSAGFTVPLALTLSLHPAGGMPNWARMVIAWVRPDGSLEPVPTYYNPVARVLVGQIEHFSQFVVAIG